MNALSELRNMVVVLLVCVALGMALGAVWATTPGAH